jgi:hypothetical protein
MNNKNKTHKIKIYNCVIFLYLMLITGIGMPYYNFYVDNQPETTSVTRLNGSALTHFIGAYNNSSVSANVVHFVSVGACQNCILMMWVSPLQRMIIDHYSFQMFYFEIQHIVPKKWRNKLKLLTKINEYRHPHEKDWVQLQVQQLNTILFRLSDVGVHYVIPVILELLCRQSSRPKKRYSIEWFSANTFYWWADWMLVTIKQNIVQ